MKSVLATDFSARNCPGCGADASRAVPGPRPRTPAEKMELAQLREPFNGGFARFTYFSYFRCKDCGLLYCPVYLTKEKLVELYSAKPDNSLGVAQAGLARTQEQYFRFLGKTSDLQGQYLEIGPDTGLFAGLCAKRGKFDRFWLIEPNQEVHQRLRGELGGKEAVLLPSMEALSEVPDGAISAAAMIHVLDHLLDPVGYMRRLRSKLRPGAKLLIVVHDQRSLLAKVCGDRWPGYHPQHPQMFDRKSLRVTVERAGFRCAAMRKAKNYIPPAFLAKKFFWVLGLGEVRIPWQDRLIIPVPLGNLMAVFEAD